MVNELKINARGLDNPGPRMLVETALARGKPAALRVIVSHQEAVDDLRKLFEKHKATAEVDQIGDEFHVLVRFRDDTGE